MLQKVLTGGGIGSAFFIEERNRIDSELEAACRRQQLLKEQKLFEQVIQQTEYLLAVFKNRPPIIEEYEEELFLMIIDRVIIKRDQKLCFRLKNGLELEEPYGKEREV